MNSKTQPRPRVRSSRPPELFRSDYFADVSLAQRLAVTPRELMKAHLKIDESVLSKVSTQKTPVVGS